MKVLQSDQVLSNIVLHLYRELIFIRSSYWHHAYLKHANHMNVTITYRTPN